MIGTDIELLNPFTGELVALSGSTPILGRYLSEIRDLESRLREQKSLLSREILRRMDQQAKWTLSLEGGFKVTGQSPKPAESWSGPELREALLDLVDRGVISIEAVDAAVETVVTYVPRKAGINALRKLGGEVAEVIAGLCVTSEPDRRVSVSRV